jgi:hypothetical protein
MPHLSKKQRRSAIHSKLKETGIAGPVARHFQQPEPARNLRLSDNVGLFQIS